MSYTLWYGVAVALTLVAALIGAIQVAYTSGHGADLGLTPQAQAWLAVIGSVVAVALGLLPSVTRTPGKRSARYHRAKAGQLPDDLK